ncbi:hypothetical protein [Rickettsia endosymbiont of Nabis limbatus]|uniref:hypothetical protein n=1 Tax=Rickettsia endosymbiont of Nabis limbatus TaxID=3066268 RepID=UPI003AF35CA2
MITDIGQKQATKSSKEQGKEQVKEQGHATLAHDSMLIVGGEEHDLNVQQLSFNDANIELDSITESIRKEILEKQREQLRLYLATLSDTYPELAEHILDDERFSKFLANLKGLLLPTNFTTNN